MNPPDFKMTVVGHSGPQNFSGLVYIFIDLILIIIPIVVAMALLVFFWGLVKFIFRVGSGDEKAVEEGKNLMKWGLIALFVMVSVWGIISLMSGEFGFGSSLTLPFLPE